MPVPLLQDVPPDLPAPPAPLGVSKLRGLVALALRLLGGLALVGHGLVHVAVLALIRPAQCKAHIITHWRLKNSLSMCKLKLTSHG